MNGFFAGFAIAILLWFFAFLYLKAFVRRRTSADHILGLLQEEVLQLEADIDVKTEQNLLLLEEKIKSLRDISNEAERRIAVYNRELENRASESITMNALKKTPPSEPLNIKAAPKEKQKEKEADPKPVTITLSREKLAIKPRPVKERIAELQKAGFAPELIAKQLGINLGEVKLYFNLAEKSEE